MKKLLIIIIAAVVAVACHDDKKATINGQYFGAANKNIVLEEVLPYGVQIVDSVRADDEGKFKFDIKFPEDANPTFYRVGFDNQFALLLVERGENINLNALGNVFINYDVTGSKGSELLHELNKQMVQTSRKLDSLANMVNMPGSENRIAEFRNEYAREYVRLKKYTISFVVKNASSLVSIVPLYHKAFNGMIIFDRPTDIAYYRAVADSLEAKYPTSPYVQSLRNDIRRVDNVMAMDSLISSNVSNVVDFPEIEMNDPKGSVKRLSSLRGKTILLSFTSSSEPKLKILNRELLSIYEQYHEKGLEIYEVSIDTDKAKWLKSITDNKLPWIQVCDLLGTDSPSLTAYNVSSLPTYFLIDSNANIVESRLEHDKVAAAVADLIK